MICKISEIISSVISETIIMNFKKYSHLIIVSFFLFPSFTFCQNLEKVIFDSKDSTAGYYLAIQPQSKNIKGAVVLLTSFLPPESLLLETKLHNVASANDILTIVVSTNKNSMPIVPPLKE